MGAPPFAIEHVFQAAPVADAGECIDEQEPAQLVGDALEPAAR